MRESRFSQHDLKSEKRRAQMGIARSSLERLTMLLLTSSKTLLRHPDSDSAQQCRDGVFDQVQEFEKCLLDDGWLISDPTCASTYCNLRVGWSLPFGRWPICPIDKWRTSWYRHPADSECSDQAVDSKKMTMNNFNNNETNVWIPGNARDGENDFKGWSWGSRATSRSTRRALWNDAGLHRLGLYSTSPARTSSRLSGRMPLRNDESHSTGQRGNSSSLLNWGYESWVQDQIDSLRLDGLDVTVERLNRRLKDLGKQLQIVAMEQVSYFLKSLDLAILV